MSRGKNENNVCIEGLHNAGTKSDTSHMLQITTELFIKSANALATLGHRVSYYSLS